MLRFARLFDGQWTQPEGLLTRHPTTLGLGTQNPEDPAIATATLEEAHRSHDDAAETCSLLPSSSSLALAASLTPSLVFNMPSPGQRLSENADEQELLHAGHLEAILDLQSQVVQGLLADFNFPLELLGAGPAGEENNAPAMNEADVYVCAHRPVPVGPNGANWYRCTHPGCGLVIIGRWNAKNHCRAVHDSHPDMFLCALCDVVFKRKADLKRHEETSSAHFNHPRFWCDVCHRGYMRKAELKRHCRVMNHELIN
ncbi:hypothetical protein HK405_001159 [Cladochytrium tenue]|nr:hypothetical protein HK405_001159 [Cladochytrium tenue]